MTRSIIALLVATSVLGAVALSLTSFTEMTPISERPDDRAANVPQHPEQSFRSAAAANVAAPSSALLGRAPARLRPAADGSDPGDGPLSNDQSGVPTGLAIAAAIRDTAADERVIANELASLEGATAAAEPFSVAALVLPVEFGASEDLTYQIHNEDGSECITVTNRFSGPLHGKIPYPGVSPEESIDNQTVYYPSTEPEDYERLIFGRTGYTVPVRAGDPNVNDGAGVDISGLTVQTYFDAQSDGTVSITGTVAPWVELPHSEAYYGVDFCIPGSSSRAIPDEQLGSLADMTADAVAALIAQGGIYATREYWEVLDQDKNQEIDGVWVVHAGRGQEYGGGSEGEESIWSRASAVSFSEAYPAGFVVHDGGTPDDPLDDLFMDEFTILPEDSDLGVLVEEFGHSAFGVPDLYTTDSSNSVGWWAPMSSGIWGGELGGTRPVNMPLWFRTVADCAGSPCGWADPVAEVSHSTAGETFIVGRAGEPAGGTVEDGPYAGETIYEGLRIELPVQDDTIPNRAGEGGGAYTGSQSGRPVMLESAEIRIGEASGPLTLTVGSAWNIPNRFGYGHVEAAVADGPFETLPDLDGFLTNDNPFRINDGNGLTGSGEGTLRFDVSDLAGSEIRLRFRYLTYRGGPDTGWWIDDVVIHGTGDVLDFGFDEGIPRDWFPNGWMAVPIIQRHPHHYLVEWRDDSGFDASLRSAYQTNYRDQDEWRVDRISANVPGAVVMYRNLKYPFSGVMENLSAHLPSWGAKYGLLVVDQNSMPMSRPSGGPFSGSLESLGAALTLQDQPDFTLELRDPETKELLDTETFTGERGNSLFDDAHGTTPGIQLITSDPEGPTMSPWDADASVVLPSRSGQGYSTRLTDERDQPVVKAFGETYVGPHVFGTGNPGDDNAQFGVHIEVIDMADDGSWGAVHVVNEAVDYSIVASNTSMAPGERVTYTVKIDNVGSVEAEVFYDLEIGYVHGDAVFPVVDESVYTATLAPGEHYERKFETLINEGTTAAEGMEVVAWFQDGTDSWRRRLVFRLDHPPTAFFPIAVRDAPVGEGAEGSAIRVDPR